MKELKECITAFEQEAKRLSIPLNREQFERDITVWLPHRADASLRIEKRMAWGHSVDIRLKVCAVRRRKVLLRSRGFLVQHWPLRLDGPGRNQALRTRHGVSGISGVHLQRVFDAEEGRGGEACCFTSRTH